MNSNTDITQILSEVEDCLLINGYFDDSLTEPIISYVTESQIDNKKNGRKLSFLIVESFQNIVRHGYDESEANKRAKLKDGFFAMLKTGSEITICTTNSIENEKVEKLENEINRLASLDKDSLKSEFIDVLSANKDMEGGGAGLGLIEIMRKTGSQFEHFFSKKGNGISYVHFNIFFNENRKENIRVHKMDTVKLREIGIESNILFLRKGLFNHDTFIQLSTVLENKANNEVQELGTTLYYIFIELIQNMYKHGLSNESGEVPGLFYVQEFDGYFYFNSQNLSSIKNASIAKKRIDNLNELSPKELLNLYKQRLTKELDFSENISGDIGLIEILKVSKNPLTCKITNVSNDSCFLTISVKLSI
jgi:hypothetical protein